MAAQKYKEKFPPPPEFESRSPETESHCATNELCRWRICYWLNDIQANKSNQFLLVKFKLSVECFSTVKVSI